METSTANADAAKTAASATDEAKPASSAQGLDLRGIAGATLIVMVFFVLSRVTGLAREIIIGAQFGTSASLDAYLAAFRLPDLLFQLVAGGALGSAFIPTFATYWVRDDRNGAWLLFSRVLNLVTLVLVLLAAAGAVFAPALVEHVIAPGFAPEQQALSASLMRWMMISTVIFGASGLVMAALNALQHFLLPALAPVVYNVSIILGAWVLAPRMGIYGLIVGVLCGAAGHLLVQIPGLFRQHAKYTFDWTVRDPGVYEVLRLMGPRVLGLLFVQLHFLVNTILASGLGEGSLSSLNYAWLLMLLPLGVFAQAIATASFPTLSAQIAAGQTEAMRATFGQILRIVFFLTIPAAAALLILRVPIIQLLFQRRQFTEQSTMMVAYALQFYALGLVAHSAVEITVRAFYALHNTWTPVLVGVAAMTLNILLSLLWVDALGYGGLALANTTATTVEMLFLLWLLRRRMGGLDGLRLAGTIARCVLATGLMAGALWLWLSRIEGTGNLPLWLTTFGGLAMGVIIYLGASTAMRSRELRDAWRILPARR
ncbi:MAG: murein biosynthesis integral membrane protein MurJ [Caldilineaceae bacterium]